MHIMSSFIDAFNLTIVIIEQMSIVKLTQIYFHYINFAKKFFPKLLESKFNTVKM